MSYTLAFGWSSSPHYPRAASLARAVPGSVTTGSGRAAHHTVPIDLRDAPTAELLGLALGWRGARLAWAGQALPRGQAQFVLWVVDCYQGRRVSLLGAEYCWDWAGRNRSPVAASHPRPRASCGRPAGIERSCAAR